LTPLAVIGSVVPGVGDGRPGLALVALSVIEQRYRAVLAVLDGARVSEVAAEVGASRQSVHAWLAPYR
jgi:Homeodomain-like domain